MFTGLIQHMGTIRAIAPRPFGARLEVSIDGWDHRPEPGASIAVNGVCLTVAGPEPSFDVVTQTLRMTALGDLAPGERVNLEHAATPTTFLGGHIVQGHVDGVGRVAEVRRGDGTWWVRVEPPAELMSYIVPKGSVALDGISLTVADVDADGFTVALIPVTLEETTIARVEPGTRLNIETDCLTKTVVHWLERTRGS